MASLRGYSPHRQEVAKTSSVCSRPPLWTHSWWQGPGQGMGCPAPGPLLLELCPRGASGHLHEPVFPGPPGPGALLRLCPRLAVSPSCRLLLAFGQWGLQRAHWGNWEPLGLHPSPAGLRHGIECLWLPVPINAEGSPACRAGAVRVKEGGALTGARSGTQAQELVWEEPLVPPACSHGVVPGPRPWPPPGTRWCSERLAAWRRPCCSSGHGSRAPPPCLPSRPNASRQLCPGPELDSSQPRGLLAP